MKCAEVLSPWDRVTQFFHDEYYVPKNLILGEIVAGIVVGLAVVPEAIAFALVVGVLPQTGINTTLITSIIMGIVGDRPGLCNGTRHCISLVHARVFRDVISSKSRDCCLLISMVMMKNIQMGSLFVD